MRKATIYDLARLCNTYNDCVGCPLLGKPDINAGIDVCLMDKNLSSYDFRYIDDLNDRIVTWCDAHPVKTRKSEFMKLFPHCTLDKNGYPDMDTCICWMDDKYIDCEEDNCDECVAKFWDEEIE